uniref:Uncharacterized protein n=1 Tax=Candidatus Kentrum sp. LFY TaxID=2126342 RepID=A0A450WC35_9GAMM|nr:MAG: hypothetical protein BECKLFY1418C_GA0070996_100946 [Candidatus Kentron sp. LFY]
MKKRLILGGVAGLALFGLTGCDPIDGFHSIVQKADQNRQWFRENVCSNHPAWKMLRKLVRSEFGKVDIDTSGYCPAVMGEDWTGD